MASSICVVLRQKPRNDGSLPLCIRVTKDRKTSYISLGHYIFEKDWNKSRQKVKTTHPNSGWMNNLVVTKLAEATDKLLELETHKKDTSSSVIKKNIKPKKGITFFEQAKSYIELLKNQKKYNRIVSEEPRLKHFKDFLKGEDITFPEITITLLKQYRAYLKGTRNVSERTIINHLIIIRTIYNQAVNEKIIDKSSYPFGKDKIAIKFPQNLKIGLNAEEVAILEKLDLSEIPRLSHARNVWLISFYFAGMRISDVLRLKWTDFQNKRLHYSMGKNAKGGSLKVPEKALKILSQYKGRVSERKLIFPELEVVEDLSNLYEVQRKTSYAVKLINGDLKEIAKLAKITKKLTMHIARHTFGNISGERIPLQMLQKLYRHSSITTTMAYQANFIHKEADDALDAVLDF